MNLPAGVRACGGGVLALVFLTNLSAQVAPPVTYLSLAQTAPIFAALDEPLPAAGEWSRWIAAADTATRARVARGDDTTIVNLLLFGTSFTLHPRITAGQLTREQIESAAEGRLRDFERALARPETNERLQFARRTLGDGAPVRTRLLAMIHRSITEGETHARLIEQAHALGDPSREFAERSRLYRDRGLASDTSVRVNLALEKAFREAGTGRVTRVAIIGPGLDVADKQEGYDFYPPQTIQPFAVIDSLIRLGVADADTLELTTFDVSARVNGHMAEMAGRARAGAPYVLHLPLDGAVAWTRELLDYFQQFGESVGAPVPVTIPASIGPVRFRAISVRPAVVSRIVARDLNITAQTLTLSDSERFDLVVGTNVFVYYDRLQQGLAMVSAANMLRPGGLLLSNNALLEVPATGLRSIGYSKTVYSSREEDGDLIVWYQKSVQVR
jgi:hypothetical protein